MPLCVTTKSASSAGRGIREVRHAVQVISFTIQSKPPPLCEGEAFYLDGSDYFVAEFLSFRLHAP